ncbi:MAG: hypothetical protein ACOCWQ_03065, partial [Nanoarchaeota archaeon]
WGVPRGSSELGFSPRYWSWGVRGDFVKEPAAYILDLGDPEIHGLIEQVFKSRKSSNGGMGVFLKQYLSRNKGRAVDAMGRLFMDDPLGVGMIAGGWVANRMRGKNGLPLHHSRLGYAALTEAFSALQGRRVRICEGPPWPGNIMDMDSLEDVTHMDTVLRMRPDVFLSDHYLDRCADVAQDLRAEVPFLAEFEDHANWYAARAGIPEKVYDASEGWNLSCFPQYTPAMNTRLVRHLADRKKSLLQARMSL